MVVEATNKRVASLLERLSEASSVPKEVVLEEALKLWAAARELDLEGPQNDEEPRCALACPLGSSEAPPRPKRRASRGPASREEEAADEGAPADEQGGWSSLECLPDILDRLKGSDGQSQLAKARMVCSHWSKAALGTVTSFDIVFDDQGSRAFRALRHCSSLKELTIFINNSGFAESFNEFISAACSLPNLKTLNLCYRGCPSEYSMLVPALLPLLPRLETLKFSAYNACGNIKAPDTSTLTQALAAASNLTDLDLSVQNPGRGMCVPNSVTRVPVEGLAALPSTLTRLRIDNVAFGKGQSLQTLCCLPHLEELWIAGQRSGCSFHGDMGLRFATSLKSLTCCFGVELKESDLEDILTLQGLRHLWLCSNITSSFVRSLPSRMPSLVSLSLYRWQCITDANIEALGSLTGLTSLSISAHYNTRMMFVSMAPESLRHLSTLTLLQKLELHNHNAKGFLDLGLPLLHALPALKSLDVAGTPVDSAEVM